MEILDNIKEYDQVIKQSFNDEFFSMLQVCIFVPFLHKDTPKPHNVPKATTTKEKNQLLESSISKVLSLRNKIIEN